MSGGWVCKCPEAKKPLAERNWRVYQRYCNHSAFSGYHYTPSRYSALCCESCRAHWRTTAAYVDKVRDATPEDRK